MQKQGSFGNIIYDGNKITIEAEPDALGDVALTTRDGRKECFWDGIQWVCNSVSSSQSPTPATISHNGNKITVEAEPGDLGDVALTTRDGRMQCFWDGNQWVCNSVSFIQSPEGQA